MRKNVQSSTNIFVNLDKYNRFKSYHFSQNNNVEDITNYWVGYICNFRNLISLPESRQNIKGGLSSYPKV